MSYLSATENVGFSGIPQNISDASCATQYKMAVEGVAGSCSGDVNMYIQDSSGDEQSYITHLNDNFFHTKFKIDPNELYTFHDSDVIASEITVSHTEDAFIFSENVDVKSKLLDSPDKEVDFVGTANGDVKEEIKLEIPNGHYSSTISNTIQNLHTVVETKTQKNKSHTIKMEGNITVPIAEFRRASIHSPKGQNALTTPVPNSKGSNSNAKPNNTVTPSTSKSAGSETFLDVFKREQGLVENAVIKTEPITLPPLKTPFTTPKKPQSGKSSSTAKSRKGRGPAVHEALQRIPSQRAIPIPIKSWHAPGEELFECGPLTEKKHFRQIESSSSDDDNMPDFESGVGPVCVEETAAESRAARLALRRAALRRHVARVDSELRFAGHHKEQRLLALLIKKQLNGKGSGGNLPPQTVNHFLALRGMPTLLSSHERRQLRETGWSGGESGSMSQLSGCCAEERCTETALPCGRYCLSHVTLAPEQRLYAACAAVFAGGARCKQPLLPLQDQTPLCAEHAWKRSALQAAAVTATRSDAAVCGTRLEEGECLSHVTLAPEQRLYAACAAVFAGGARCKQPLLPLQDQTPLCAEHAWKRDNYDKLARDCRPKKPVRKRIWAAPVRPPRRAKRRRRPPARPPPPAPQTRSPHAPPPPEQSLSEVNVCSNSSAYDSSEDTAIGALSENEYITVASGSHELEVEVENAPHDDILDPSVLSQIPDEAFTEFFNQAEGGTTFAESSELAAALEAVLDERVLDERVMDERALDNIADSVFLHSQIKAKIQVPASVPMEMSTSAPS